MCLTITVRSNELTDDDRRRLAKRVPLLHRGRDKVLSIHGCDFLSDSADWNAPTWDLTADGRKVLADLLRHVMDDLTGGIEVTALWDGDRAEVEHPVTAPQLLSLIADNRLETRAKVQRVSAKLALDHRSAKDSSKCRRKPLQLSVRDLPEIAAEHRNRASAKSRPRLVLRLAGLQNLGGPA